MDQAIAPNYRCTVDAICRSVIKSDMPTGFFDEKVSGRNVPRIQAFFPKSVETSARHVGHIDRCRPIAADAPRTHKKVSKMPAKVRATSEIVGETGNQE